MVGAIHRPAPPGVIDVFDLADLRGIAAGPDGVRIGAATTYADLLASDLVRRELPILHRAAREIGAAQIQERGTLGGNVATSSPVGDTLPVLLALDATVELASTRGPRRVPYAGFTTGYRRTALGPDELVAAILLPRRSPGQVDFWRKVGTRRAQAISKVVVAASAVLEGGRLRNVRLAMGAVADRPIRLARSEALLEGARPDPEIAQRLAAEVRAEIRPISDVRSTREYRLETAARLAARWILDLLGPAARR
mgnify:CR=1 FL=1